MSRIELTQAQRARDYFRTRMMFYHMLIDLLPCLSLPHCRITKCQRCTNCEIRDVARGWCYLYRTEPKRTVVVNIATLPLVE